jgi:short-subunit dehydrogenase
MDLKNQLAIITGVSRGIGYHTAKQLLDQGAKVAGWGRTEPEGLNDDNFQFYKADVKDYNSLEGAYNLTKRDFGQPPAILINNAGYGNFKPVEDFTVQEWNDIFQTNVHGPFYCSKLTVPDMKEQRFGHIINISSIAGIQGQPQGTAYNGTKYALRGFSDCLFKEVRDHGIKVTCVFPGSTQTDFFDNAPGMEANPNMMRPEDVALELIRLFQTHDNFLINEMTFRPLMPKGPPK